MEYISGIVCKERIAKDDMQSQKKVRGKWEKWKLPNMYALEPFSLG